LVDAEGGLIPMIRIIMMLDGKRVNPRIGVY
jgi:hypothetical protein